MMQIKSFKDCGLWAIDLLISKFVFFFGIAPRILTY